MENNNINTVTLPLSDYNILKSNQDATRDLLNKATTELNILRAQAETNPKNRVIVERTELDRYGNRNASEKLRLDIADPEASAKILDIISKVETSELSKTIEEKEVEIKKLKTKVNDVQDVLENAERSYKYSARREEEAKREEIRKLKKGYDETVLDLEIEKETLVKSLSDLKKDKTAQQLEIERVRELDELKSKIAALELLTTAQENMNFFEFRRFKTVWNNAKKFLSDNPWADKVWNVTRKALDNVESFTRMLKEVGKLPSDDKSKQPTYNYYTTNYNSDGCCDCCDR